MRARAVIAATVAAFALLSSAAQASWTPAGAGGGSARAKALPAVAQPTATVSGRNVAVSWSAPTGGAPPSGYSIRVYAADGSERAIGAACAGTVASTGCTEQGVQPGAWRYTVTPVIGNWAGGESDASSAASVGSPTLSLTPATVASLPATLTGQLSNYRAGQSASFRLDNATTGTVLTGSITPSTVPANGAASVSVTIPAGTSTGAHTIYAIGSAGDVASAATTVAIPSTLATTAWDLRDASSGTESNVSDAIAYADDGRTYTTSAAPAAFAANRWLAVDFNAALASSAPPSAVNLELQFANPGAGTGCFYFETRRASTDAVLATHGSSASPAGCVTGTSKQPFSISLPEVTSAAIANDLRTRIFVRQSAGSGLVLDRVNVSGTAAATAFTLYDRAFTDRANGSNTVRTWPLAEASDTLYYSSASTWTTSFASARYLRLAFPSYIGSSETVSNANFKFVYRSNGGGTTCWYSEVLQGSTVIGTHGSSSSPVSCNSSSSAFVTDTVPLPEVDTPAKANGAVIKIYVRNSSSQRIQVSQAQLSVDRA
jgi:hypothetical protein